MINKISELILQKYLLGASINQEDKELYQYGITLMFTHIFFFAFALICGAILSCLIESLIFYTEFQLIRIFAGGYHASSERKCEIMSSLLILACILLIRLASTVKFDKIVLTIAIISAICIFILCPLDTPEKPLSNKEFRCFRKLSRLILLILIAIIIISYVLKWKIALVPSCMSVILESLLLVAGKVKKVYQIKNAKQ